ncbi:hypothetical protein MC7420_4184 [Coleofasciculus chthonoplastes PCC 7420]|uniref:Uncharacterized protein n=1 Tax=Coleofasciculus chthonoplastes PCC 7420 TaxID=118168 RepID=B4VUX9_9CYAN|nr:hypothetical protein MC7420_4184 [Coleofasciculus chthonoplastes PCC 7420]
MLKELEKALEKFPLIRLLGKSKVDIGNGITAISFEFPLIRLLGKSKEANAKP